MVAAGFLLCSFLLPFPVPGIYSQAFLLCLNIFLVASTTSLQYIKLGFLSETLPYGLPVLPSYLG